MFLSFMIHSPWSEPNIYSDIGSFWGRAEVQHGLVPYFQFFFEYPPISGCILYLARTLGGNVNGYFEVFGVISLIAALGIAWSCWRIANLLGTRLSPLYFFLPSVIFYGFYNFDLFNALFIILSVQFLLEGRKGASAAALGLSIATKLVGGVLLPIYLLELRSHRAPDPIGSGKESGNSTRGVTVSKRNLANRTRKWFKVNRVWLTYLATTAAVAAIFYLPIAFLNFNYFFQFYSYLRGWGLEDAWYIWIFQDPFSAAAKWFGLVISVILILRVYTLKVSLVPKVFLGLAAYLLGSYIYSPQFNVMLIPLVIVLAIDDPSLYAWEVFNALIILTWFLVGNPTSAWTLPQAMSLLRTASLGWLCLALLHRCGIRPVELVPSFLRRRTLLDSTSVSGA